MSVVDQKRLPVEIFNLDTQRMRQGWYTDRYFNNSTFVLGALAEEGYRFQGACAELAAQGVDVARVDVGNIEVEMQYFTRRSPYSLVAGVDEALAMLRLCTGFHDEEGRFVSTADGLEIDAVHDGARVEPREPVLRVRGRYRDFAILETPTLGALARRTRVATNVYQALQASGGKPLLFFPARFDLYAAQAGDGYAYKVAVDVWNQERRGSLGTYISTEAQGEWWAGEGSGTMAHAYLLCFLRDTVEATLRFASLLPVDVKRVALVDVNNDCVGDSVRTAEAMFRSYRELVEAGRSDEAERFVLFGVRPDTSGDMVDASVAPLGDAALDCGVNPRLVHNIRQALDTLADHLELPYRWLERARGYFRNIKIVATGGFTPQRIQQFETLRVPVDIYGVGSYFFEGENNDFTADIVRVKIDGGWHDMAKTGRGARRSDQAHPVVF